VFTGAFNISRKNTRRLLEMAGGIFPASLSQQGRRCVFGVMSPHFKADTKGQKLLDLEREYERGNVAVIGEKKFLALADRRWRHTGCTAARPKDDRSARMGHLV